MSSSPSQNQPWEEPEGEPGTRGFLSPVQILTHQDAKEEVNKFHLLDGGFSPSDTDA